MELGEVAMSGPSVLGPITFSAAHGQRRLAGESSPEIEFRKRFDWPIGLFESE